MNKKLFPVIHISSSSQVKKDISHAQEVGVDGVFLINHGLVSNNSFYNIIESCIEFQTSLFPIGINFLGIENEKALDLALKFGTKMLWVDNAGVDSQPEIADKIYKQAIDKIKYFGGVQFKYQSDRGKKDIFDSIKSSLGIVEIPTLSGIGTGKAADLDFIKRAFSAANGMSLAIASGISVDNVDFFLPYIDYFLVATSILDDSGYYLCPKKLKSLTNKIHT